MELANEAQLVEYMRNPTFKFTVSYKSMKYREVLDNFGFDSYIYFSLVILLCLVILLIIFSIWMYYYKNSTVVPRPQLKVQVYWNNSLKSFIGLFMSFLPVGIIYKVSYYLVMQTELFSSLKGDYLYDLSTADHIAKIK